ncbi:MAG TPA: hypothetical protein VMD99_12370 [Terriglobales bacterium]|nr:hypothetical protein [Terriglobales bacterium]
MHNMVAAGTAVEAVEAFTAEVEGVSTAEAMEVATTVAAMEAIAAAVKATAGAAGTEDADTKAAVGTAAEDLKAVAGTAAWAVRPRCAAPVVPEVGTQTPTVGLAVPHRAGIRLAPATVEAWWQDRAAQGSGQTTRARPMASSIRSAVLAADRRSPRARELE